MVLHSLPLIAAFSMMGIVLLWNVLSSRKRRDALATLAAHSGFTFDPGPLPNLRSDWFSFPLFTHGRSPRVSNIGTRSDRDTTLAFFDFRYVTGHGKNRRIHSYFVIARFGQTSLPQFTLEREGFFSKLAQMVGYADIDFPHDPEFSKLFVLRGENEVRIRQVFSPALIATLKREPNTALQAGTQGILWSCRTLAPEDLPSTLQKVQGIFDLVR